MNAVVNSARAPARILLLDDEEPILNALRRLFRQDGYEIDATTKPEEGLYWVAQKPYDVVISDMRMPSMDGATFLQAVAEYAPKTVRLLLTGFSEQESTVRAINLGKIHAYLSKPWNNDDLRARVKDALQTKARADEQDKLMTRLRFVNEKLGIANKELKENLKETANELEQTTAFLDCAHEELKNSFSSVVSAFACMLNERLPAAINQSQVVERDAVELMKRLGGDESQVTVIRHAAQLHQMGKFAFADQLLMTPYHQLNADERAIVDAYPSHIDSGLRAISTLKPILDVIEFHQERFDGKGFPGQRFGTTIPFGARVLKPVVDFHLLMSGQLDPMLATRHDAIHFLMSHSGKAYDPDIVAAYVLYLQEDGDHDEDADVSILSAHETGNHRELVRDLFSPDGMLLLAKGTVTTSALMQRLQEWERRQGQPLYLMTRPAT